MFARISFAFLFAAAAMVAVATAGKWKEPFRLVQKVQVGNWANKGACLRHKDWDRFAGVPASSMGEVVDGAPKKCGRLINIQVKGKWVKDVRAVDTTTSPGLITVSQKVFDEIKKKGGDYNPRSDSLRIDGYTFKEPNSA